MGKQEAAAAYSWEARYLLILGCTVRGDRPTPLLQARIDCAAQYLKRHPKVIAVASGACFRTGQRKSEARVIKEGLCAAGIEPNRIFLEEQARSTAENFSFCKQILQQLSPTGSMGPIVFVTNDFHVKRCLKLALLSGLCAAPIPAPTPKGARLRCHIRERLVSLPLRLSAR